jgi:hypothetical protein
MGILAAIKREERKLEKAPGIGIAYVSFNGGIASRRRQDRRATYRGSAL